MPKSKRPGQIIAVLSSLLFLAACGKGAPSGQVVATVDGEEITAAELRLEIAQISPDLIDPATAQQQALQRIITRKLLAKEAERRKIPESPKGATLAIRAHELAMIQLLQAKLNDDAPLDTSDTAINRFIDAHPSQFSDRKLITVDQLIIPTSDPLLAPRLQVLPGLADVEALLTRENTGFIRSGNVLDTADMVPAAASRISGMSPDSLYIAPNGRGTLRVLRIVSSRSQPLIGDDARNAALRLMEYARAQSALASIQKVINDGKSRIWIDPTFLKN